MAPHLVMAPHLARSAYKVKGQQSAHLSLSLSLKSDLVECIWLEMKPSTNVPSIFIHIFYLFSNRKPSVF